MKNKMTLMAVLIMICSIAMAQAPEKINYQAVARGSSGQALANQNLSVRMTIHSGSAGGTVVYQETHSVTTNQFGLFTLAIGGGAPVSGTVAAIDWAANSYYAETEIDPAGGSSYTSLGTAQLLSVPYALYAKDGGPWDRSGNNISNTNSGNVGIGSTTPTAKFQVTESTSSTLVKLKRTGAVSGTEMMQVECDSISINYDLISLNVPASSPSTAQFIEFERGNIPVAQINTNGDIKTDGEYNRNSTGSANLVPIAYGTVYSNGTIYSGTGNFSVTRTATGTYVISITGEAYTTSGYTTVATIITSGFPGMVTTSANGSQQLVVYTYDYTGTDADRIFQFVTYKN